MEFGVNGGFNWSYLSSIDNSKYLTNFHLGFYFDFKLKNDWYLNTGVRVKSNVGTTNLAPYSLGDKDLDTVLIDGHVTRKIGYFYVPVHIKYRFARQFLYRVAFRLALEIRPGIYSIIQFMKKMMLNLPMILVNIMKDTNIEPYNINSKNSTFYIYVCIPVETVPECFILLSSLVMNKTIKRKAKYLLTNSAIICGISERLFRLVQLRNGKFNQALFSFWNKARYQRYLIQGPVYF